jgi:hypothetical protein
MRHQRKGIAVLAVASLALFAAGCNKGPAEDALQAADQALAAAKADVGGYLPGQLTPLDDAMAAARAEFQKGNYTEALEEAQALTRKVEEAVAASTKKKDELTAVWAETSARLPGAVRAITARMSALAAAKSLPTGMTRELLLNHQKDLDAVTRAWNDASAAFQDGDVPRAVRMAGDVEARADALAGALGLTAAPGAVAK